MLKLPAYQDLSREQLEIYNLPLNGSYLVVGPPGTGKTIMGLHRASMYLRAELTTHFMVYSNPLTQYLAQAVAQEQLKGAATTLHHWFKWWYRKNLGCFPPQLAPFVYNWVEVLTELNRQLGAGKEIERYDHIVIDEGQDFPKEFYFVLRLITANVTVFADENQRITDTNSTLKEIKQALGLQSHQVYMLTRNYRNTRPIAEFAAQFYSQLRSGIPQFPTRGGPKPRLLLAPSLQAQINFIARYERNNADKDIAIFVEKTGQQRQIYEMLTGHTTNTVQIYVSKDKENRKLDFSSRGIRILTYASAKGLEFDTVFLPLLDRSRSDPESDLVRMRFYVLASRARQELTLLSGGQSAPPIVQQIPIPLYTVEYIR